MERKKKKTNKNSIRMALPTVCVHTNNQLPRPVRLPTFLYQLQTLKAKCNANVWGKLFRSATNLPEHLAVKSWKMKVNTGKLAPLAKSKFTSGCKVPPFPDLTEITWSGKLVALGADLGLAGRGSSFGPSLVVVVRARLSFMYIAVSDISLHHVYYL